MRILKILGGDDYGGQYVCECQFIDYWINKGVVVDAYIIGEGRAVDKYKKLLSSYIMLPAMNAEFGGGLNKIISGIKESFDYAERNTDLLIFTGKYDAVIYRSQSFIKLASDIAKKSDSTAYWHLPNSLNRRLSKLYYNISLRMLDIVPVANSNYTRKSIGRFCDYVVYPGFNESRVVKSKPVFKDRLNVTDDVFIVGTAARIHPSKAQDVLIRAFIESRLHENGGHLLIAGIIEDRSYYSKCAGLLKGYEDHIHFLENVEDMSAFYSSIDVYVNSRIDAEPFGISIAEALGAGKPVIAYYKGGPNEMIISGENGKLIFTPDFEEYKKAMLYIFNNKSLFDPEKIKRTAQKFNYKNNAERFLEIINK